MVPSRSPAPDMFYFRGFQGPQAPLGVLEASPRRRPPRMKASEDAGAAVKTTKDSGAVWITREVNTTLQLFPWPVT